MVSPLALRVTWFTGACAVPADTVPAAGRCGPAATTRVGGASVSVRVFPVTRSPVTVAATLEPTWNFWSLVVLVSVAGAGLAPGTPSVFVTRRS